MTRAAIPRFEAFAVATRWARTILPGTLLALQLVGCGIDLKDGAGPRVPIPNLMGSVRRAGSAAAGLRLELRTIEGQVVASTVTTSAGSFGFQVPASGAWEVKVSSERAGDFAAITHPLQYQEPGTEVIAPLDVFAYGAELLEPAADGTAPVPSLLQPLMFQWTLPSLSGVTARVQCFAPTGTLVWNSTWLDADHVAWNGVANQGDSAGHIVAAGTYTWRMKFSLPDSSEGRTATRTLTLR